MGHNTALPDGLARLGGTWLTGSACVNVVPVGATTMTIHGEGDDDPGAIATWEAVDWTGEVIAEGGPIDPGDAFPLDAAMVGGGTLSDSPRWFHVYFTAAGGGHLGGGMVVVEPAGTPWPTTDAGDYPRVGFGYRHPIGNAAAPGTDNSSGGSWGVTPDGDGTVPAGGPDQAADAYGEASPYDTADPVRKANRVDLITYTHYAGTTEEQAGVTSTAARYAGMGFWHEITNEPFMVGSTVFNGGGAPDADFAPTAAAFARAVWAGDPDGTPAVPCAVSFNRHRLPRLRRFFLALKDLLTTDEWAKIAVTVHDYNTSHGDLQMGDECWAPFVALLQDVGLDTAPRAVTEGNAYEATHGGAGDLVRQAPLFAGSVLLAEAYGIPRERFLAYYLRQHGHPDFWSWLQAEFSQPYPAFAWALTHERETRRTTFAARHDAGTDAATVLSLRFDRADGTGVVVAKAYGRSSAPVVYQLAGDTLPGSVTLVDWQGRTSSAAVDDDGQAVVELGQMPTYLRTPADVTATLVPTARAPYLDGTVIAAQPASGLRPDPGDRSGGSRQSLGWDIGGWAQNGRNLARRGLDPFADGEWIGDSFPLAVVSTIEIACPVPRHESSTIVAADLEVYVGGEWVPLEQSGDEVTIGQRLPYRLTATTSRDAMTGWYVGYDTGDHRWVIDLAEPVTCTAWRAVVHQVTAGESPSVATFTSSPGPHTIYPNDYAGFGTETPYLDTAQIGTRGVPVDVPPEIDGYLSAPP